MASNQQEKYLEISTPLGADVLTLVGISCDDSISNLFHYTLELYSVEQAIKAEDIVGKPVDFSMLLRDGSKREFHGYVSQFVSGALRRDGHRSYQAVIVPWVWFLTKTCDHKIFQNISVDKIIEDVFATYGFTDFKLSINKTCPTRDYCVQYAESAFDFVCRLMEEEGLFYYFTHQKGKHTLVIADSNSCFTDCEENELVFLDNIADEHLHSWAHCHAFTTGTMTGNSYSFEEPKVSLLKEVKTVVKLTDNEKYEHYEYPYNYKKANEAEPMVKARIEAEEAQHHSTEASGTYRSLQVGGKFKIKTHECSSEEGKEYVITNLRFDTSEDVTATGGNPRSYFNQFVCIPAAVKPKPKRITPRPRIYGLQTAVVVGPSGEELYTDKYGRVKVQFHWDRDGQNDENSSCWVRVSQTWAGNTWGGIILPRIGQEVVISFLNGDPDNPLITGQVYNASNMPPYPLPDNQTQSGFKTRSTPKGSASTFNELRFEDKKDAEEIYMHAQKDFNIEINENLNTIIEEGNDTYQLKKGNVIETVTEGNVTTTYTKGKHTFEITEGDQQIDLKKGKQAIKLTEGDQEITLNKGNQKLTLDSGDQEVTLKSGDQTVTLNSGNLTTKLDSGESSLETSDKIECKVGGNSSTIDTSKIESKVGGNSTTIDSSKIELKVGGNSIKIEAAGITLTCGGNSIKMDPSGVTVKGMMVKIEGSVMTEVKGSAMAKIQGGITMIN